MAGKPFLKVLGEARLLASGIRKNLTLLAKRSIDEQRAQEFDTLAQELEDIDKEQESLKARLKNITEELNAKTKFLRAEMSNDVQVIKADVPQSLWKEFGIQAKK